MNEAQGYLLEVQDMAIKLKKLKEKDLCKFYEFKGIVETITAMQSGKGIESILLKISMD